MDSKIKSTDFIDLVDTLYEAGMNPDLWTQWTEQLSSLLPDEVNFLLLTHNSLTGEPVSALTTLGPDVMLPYQEYYGKINDLWPVLGRYPTNSPFLTDDFFPIKNFQGCEIYADWLKPNELTAAAGMNICAHQEQSTAMTFFYSDKQSHNFNSALLDLTRRFRPHFLRALEMNRRFAALDFHSQSLEQVIKFFDQPALLLDEHGKIIFSNHHGETSLREMRGIYQSSRGILQLSDHAANEKLGQLMRETCSQTHKNSNILGAVGFPTQNPPSMNNIYICPLQSGPSASNTSTQHIWGPVQRHQYMLALITYSGDPPTPPGKILQDLFGLTPIELQLCTTLLAGGNLQNYSDKRKVTKDTARKQLRSVFHKTGVSSQIELIVLMNKLTSVPLRSPPK